MQSSTLDINLLDRTCFDCVHCFYDRGWECRNLVKNVSIVTGSVTFQACEIRRSGFNADTCGKEGKEFVPRPPKKSLFQRLFGDKT